MTPIENREQKYLQIVLKTGRIEKSMPNLQKFKWELHETFCSSHRDPLIVKILSAWQQVNRTIFLAVRGKSSARGTAKPAI
jgi:hypothetical protein